MLFTIYTMSLAPIIVSAVLAKTEMATNHSFQVALRFFFGGGQETRASASNHSPSSILTRSDLLGRKPHTGQRIP